MQTSKRVDEQRFEFVLYINEHIICQRYFSIWDFNPSVVNSLELKELMDKLVGVNNDGLYQKKQFGLITEHLKKKSMDFLWRRYNPWIEKNDPFKNNFEKEDIFNFEIKLDKEIIAQSTFSGNYFPQDIRYQVDIKELIPSIIFEIKNTFSLKNYTKEYINQEL